MGDQITYERSTPTANLSQKELVLLVNSQKNSIREHQEALESLESEKQKAEVEVEYQKSVSASAQKWQKRSWIKRAFHRWRPPERRHNLHSEGSSEPTIHFNKSDLDRTTHWVHNPHPYVVDKNRPPTVNIYVPAFSLSTISAGFFGVFAFALFVASQKINTRLIFFESFSYDEDAFSCQLSKTPGLEKLLENVEVYYAGKQTKPIPVSPDDLAVATVWYSAYHANAERQFCGTKYFLYLIQDYEPAFYAASTNYTLARSTYFLPHKAWFSTSSLKNFFVGEQLANGSEWSDYCVYNNAATISKDLKKLETRFLSKERNFVFYSRPTVDRNMFTLGALALIEAVDKGVFKTGHTWNFYGIGIGSVVIHIGPQMKLNQMPRMALAEYQEKISQFDIALSLMASPHPSMVPFDLAGSGCIVVTNSFKTKTQDYFSSISSNIVCSEPNLENLVKGIEIAVSKVDDIQFRRAGLSLNFPTDWAQTWTLDHKLFIRSLWAQKK